MITLSPKIFRFPPELNEEFLREYGHRSVRVVRFAAGVALAICLLLEFWPYASNNHRGEWIYAGVNVPGLSLWIALTFFPKARRYLHAISAVLGFLVLGAGNMLFLIYVPEAAPKHYPQAALLVTIFYYCAIRLPFLWATALGWLYGALFVGCAASIGVFPPDRLHLIVAYLISANLLGMYVAYSLEAAIRVDFLRRRDIAAERARSEKLLLNILPAPVAERLKAGEKAIAEDFDDATILFADIVGYTQLASKMTADQLVALLNDVFSRFDRLCDLRGAEKIKTIGDAYMAVGGITKPMTAQADTMAELGVDMLDELETVNRQRGLSLKLRVGLHSGPVVAGVIGDRKFSYDLWGDSVNVASRMESHGVPGAVHLSEDVANKLSRLKPERRGTIEVKGKGLMTTFLLQH